MIRRVVRIAVAGFCLVSLLAALATAWLWWECRRGWGYMVEIAGAGIRVSGASDGLELSVDVLLAWPGPAEFHAGAESETRPAWNIKELSVRHWEAFGVKGDYGHIDLYLTDANTPARPSLATFSAPLRSSGRMPAWSVGNVPHAAVLVATLLPPMLWTGVRWRRARKRRRRVRLGLCVACGYDLRHSPERCPECGSRVTRKDAAMPSGSSP